MRGGASAVKKAKEAGLNEAYLEVLKVKLGGVEWSIFGSMSWTVSQAKKHPWDEVHRAYVEVTGDERDNVDKDMAVNVVAGELQLSWAQATGREDLLDNLRSNQDKRIKECVEYAYDPEKPKRKKSGGGSKRKRVMGPNGQAIPERGASGTAAKLMQQGELNRKVIEEKTSEENPDVKNIAPAVSWAAKCVGVELT